MKGTVLVVTVLVTMLVGCESSGLDGEWVLISGESDGAEIIHSSHRRWRNDVGRRSSRAVTIRDGEISGRGACNDRGGPVEVRERRHTLPGRGYALAIGDVFATMRTCLVHRLDTFGGITSKR